jgi:deoxyribonuclease-4
MLLGAHVSIAGGLERAPREARQLRCSAVQIFSRPKLTWRFPALDPRATRTFHRQLREAGVETAMAHGSYLINLASPDPALLARSREALADEIRRAARLGIPYLVIHPGAHTGSGEEAGMATIIESVRQALRAVRSRVVLLLENTAGQGTGIGHRLEHLAAILDGIRARRRLGVCLDTCHLFAAGYDLRTPATYAATLDEVERTVGIERVRAFHLNDSRGGLGCRVDRHAEIGMGEIGREAFRLLVNDPRLATIPGVLETPGGLPGFRRNLARLRRLVGQTRPGDYPRCRPRRKAARRLARRQARD